MHQTSKPSHAEDAPINAVFRAFAPYKTFLAVFAGFGLVVINGAFLYYAFSQPEVVSAAMDNPVSLVFMLEAFIIVGFGAWLAAQLGLRKPGWAAFVVLSIVGSMAFSVPAFILLHIRKLEKRVGHSAGQA